MEKSDDRISELPEVILLHILSLMPMKSATRTSILSRRWRDQWKCFWPYSKILDFGKEFASAQTNKEFTVTVNRYIQQHRGNKVETFRLYFDPDHQFWSDTEKWIEFASMKGVTDLDLNFCHYYKYDPDKRYFVIKPFKLPNCLFSCDSLIHLKVSLCNFNCPSNFNGFHALETLHLRRLHLTSEMLESLVLNCPLLEELSLKECFDLYSIKVSGPSLRLKILIVLANQPPKIEISAPNLRSFHYCGVAFYGQSFTNIPSLVDVVLNSVGYQQRKPKHDYIQILKDLVHVKVLTVCDGPLKITISAQKIYHTREDLPITFHNLEELQLLLTSDQYLSYLHGFFKSCFFPSLEKLFIQVGATGAVGNFDNKSVKELSDCIFDKLKLIKITGIMGHTNEMQLVKFLLEKATVLETLILIVHKDSFVQMEFTQIQPLEFLPEKATLLEASTLIVHKNSIVQSEFTQFHPLMSFPDQLLSLPKTSLDARIVLCKQSDDDNNLWPTHTEPYSSVEFNYEREPHSSVEFDYERV